MALNTCAQVISLAKELEGGSAEFYKTLAEKYERDEDVLLSLAKENGKNIVQIERAYYGVITDAIEGCFAFNMNPDDYRLNSELAERASYSEALEQALEIEEKMIDFYSVAAEQSKYLMADIPRAFSLIVKKRDNQRLMLKSLLSKGG